MKTRTTLLTLLALLLVVPFGEASATSKRKGPYDFNKPTRTKQRNHFKLTFEYTPQYDNNILKYSDYDVERFDNSTEPNPTPVSSLSDWRNQFALKASRSKKWFLNKQTTLSATLRWNIWANSSVLNSNAYWMQWEQEIIDPVDFKVAYSLWKRTPLRSYTDRDTREWHLAQFDQNEYTFRLEVDNPWLQSVTVKPYYQIRNQYYNEYFTEFDMTGHTSGFDFAYRLFKGSTITAGYEFTSMDNTGRDQSIGSSVALPVSEDSEYGNASYQEDELRFDVSSKFVLPKLGDMRWGLDYTYRNRQYITDNSVSDDPFHAGRSHKFHRVGVEIGGDPIHSTSVTIRVENESRRSDSPNPNVPKYKDYDATRIAINLAYRIF
ncbi:MAG: hypothetical protein OEM52_10010 [bacterium]|nr:hypothetical protein [bacterium]